MSNLLGESSRTSLASQLPTLQIKQGQIVLEDKKPVFIFDRDYRIAVIDVDAFPEKYAAQAIPFFINKHSVFVYNGAGNYFRSIDFADFIQESRIMNESEFLDIFSSIHSRLPFTIFVIMLPVMLLTQFVVIMITLSVFSGIVWVYGKVSELNLEFQRILRLGIFSAFPALALDLLMDVYCFISTGYFFEYYFKMHSPMKRNIIFIISIAYFVFAVRSALEKKRK